MRRRLNPGHLALALLAMLSWAASARAASIQGRVLHASRPGAAAGLAVHLHGLARDGKAIERETRTDAVGHYRFETLPGHGAYFIAAEFEEVRFSGRLVTVSTVDADRVETVDIEIYDASNDPSSVSVEREQWVVEREAGVYRMRQTVSIRNSAQRVVIVEPEAKAALRIGLARGAGPVRTPLGPLPAGIDVVRDLLELRGPIYPGERDYSFLYDIGPATEPGGAPRALDTELRIPADIPELNLFVKDFGIEVGAGGLHASRPARERDVFYLSFVGFDLAAGSVVPLRVKPLPPRQALPRSIQVAGVATLAGLLAWFVAAPFRSSRVPGHAPGPEADAASTRSAALRTALADLEHDFETGKLSDEDRNRLQKDLEAVHQVDAGFGKTREREAGAAAGRCGCGRRAEPGDRFCAACGSSL